MGGELFRRVTHRRDVTVGETLAQVISAAPSLQK